MKYLKIEDNKAFFLRDKEQPDVWTVIDEIDKDDLMRFLDYSLLENFEMDAFSEEILANKAHQIIYGNIYEKLKSFMSNKDRFKDETESIYKEALEKYQ
jgi:hypothetical protein